ncbi:hypothetical protein G9C98_000905 [Cotesia typhae]|uniref:Exoribonuclease phosphorolytic domain-containing protein n=1 Tax=Cotesia typhae TaxID=2053667 RepID=A0A8J5R806_9HYME|nr:hypothetical protein G9C98_000905 [Cotesia typhae]
MTVWSLERAPLRFTWSVRGPPSKNAQVATKLVDQILNNSQAVDLHELCICKNKLVWVLYCDLECIDCDGDLLLADPTDEEEALALSKITIVMDKNEICFLHKSGGVPISSTLLKTCIDQSKKRAEKISSLIRTAIKDL